MLSGLVVGHKSDGRFRYDPQIKQEHPIDNNACANSIRPPTIRRGISAACKRGSDVVAAGTPE